MSHSYDGAFALPDDDQDAWGDLPWPDDLAIRARDGAKHDLTGDIWSVSAPLRSYWLDWRSVRIPAGPILDAAKAFIRERIELRAYDTAAGEFDAIHRASRTAAIARDLATMQTDPAACIGTDVLHEMIQRRVHRVRVTRWRSFYAWAARMGDTIRPPRVGFDRCVAEQLLAIKIEAPSTEGKVVLELDPEKGPLIDLELQALVAALSDRRRSASLTLQERVILWLCLSLGSNAGPLALLRASDLVRLASEAGVEAYFLRVPRQKKQGDEYRRKSLKLRRINPALGELVEALVERNRRRGDLKAMQRNGWAMPLFLSPTPKKHLSDDAHKEYTMHFDSGEISTLVWKAAAKLDVVSPRTGRRLHVTPRRLRHTLATNFAALGIPPFAIAEALDHSSLNTVMVYVDNIRVIQERIDHALAEYMAEVSGGFLGRLIPDEVAAGGSAADRIYADFGEGEVEAVGNCGLSSECNLAPPISCYKCRFFRPWLDASHERVLEMVEARAHRLREAGAIERLVELNVDAIRAIRNLMNEASALRKAGGGSI